MHIEGEFAAYYYAEVMARFVIGTFSNVQPDSLA